MTVFRMIATVLALLVTSCGSERNSSEDSAKTQQMETALPYFEATNLDGANISSEDFQGKVLVVDFWATWCKPCLTEIPSYNKLNAKYQDKNFKLLGIALSSGDVGTVKEFARKHNMRYPVYVGTPVTAAAFGSISVMPTTFVLDQNGAIVKAIEGAHPSKIPQLDRLIDQLLAAESESM